MQVSKIKEEILEAISQRGCFLVDVEISKDDDITISIESNEGIVDISDCVYVSDRFQEIFDREVEDYSLTVTSAGLDQPFKVLQQYQKALNTEVEVKLKGGKKIIGILRSADTDKIQVEYSAKESVEGQKKKQLVQHVDTFTMEEINTVTPHIVFK